MVAELKPFTPVPSNIPEAPPARRNLGIYGASLLSVAVGSGYVSLISYYVSQRAGELKAGNEWFGDDISIPLTQPNYMGVSVILGLLAVWWMVHAVRRGDRANGYLAAGTSLLFGFGFVVQTLYLLELLELDVTASDRALLVHVLVVSHLILVVIGSVAILSVAIRTLIGDYVSSKDVGSLVGVGVYWTMVAATYALLWYVVYITK